jgi:hypothetical protein
MKINDNSNGMVIEQNGLFVSFDQWVENPEGTITLKFKNKHKAVLSAELKQEFIGLMVDYVFDVFIDLMDSEAVVVGAAQ